MKQHKKAKSKVITELFSIQDEKLGNMRRN